MMILRKRILIEILECLKIFLRIFKSETCSGQFYNHCIQEMDQIWLITHECFCGAPCRPLTVVLKWLSNALILDVTAGSTHTEVSNSTTGDHDTERQGCLLQSLSMVEPTASANPQNRPQWVVTQLKLTQPEQGGAKIDFYSSMIHVHTNIHLYIHTHSSSTL